MNETLILHVYLVDDMATIHEELDSFEASKLIVSKGYKYFKITDKYTEHFEFTKAYVKEDSIAVLSINKLNTNELVNLFNDIVFTPNQIAKEYRKKNNKYPVFTEVGTNLLARDNCKEQSVKMVFTDNEVSERTIIKDIAAFENMQDIINKYDDVSLFSLTMQPVKSTLCTVTNLLELGTDKIREARKDLHAMSAKNRELAVMKINIQLLKQQKILDSYKSTSNTTDKEPEQDKFKKVDIDEWADKLMCDILSHKTQ